MKRQIEQLDGGRFDLLVIGGGIYGSWIAYDAALRGLSVALVERGDWAEGTSSRSSKLIHGGLRYLEHYEFGLVRKTLKERRLLQRLAPHLVHPLRFALPVARGARPGRLKLRAGLFLYDLLAGGDPTVGRHESLGRAALARRYPFLRHDTLVGGFTYGDAQTDDARMVIEIVDGALQAGVAAANRVAATGLLREGDRVVGATLRDEVHGRTFAVRSTVVANCAGPWTRQLDPESAPRYRLTKGVHLLLPALPTDDAFLFGSPADGRIIFVIPWYGRTLLGTTDTDYGGDPGAVAVERDDVDYLLRVAGDYIATPRWTHDDVIGAFAGLRVLPASDADSPSAVSREWTWSRLQPGLYGMVGGKYTSARADAAIAVDAMADDFGREVPPSSTATRAMPWAPDLDDPEWMQQAIARGGAATIDAEAAVGACQRFGRRVDAVFARTAEDGTAADRIVAELTFTWAELDVAALEMVESLEDLLRRRLPLSLVIRFDEALARRCAERVAAQLGWDAPRIDREVAAFLHGDVYATGV